MPPPERHLPQPLNKCICIVDDDEWVRDSLKVLLETFGFMFNPTARDANSLPMRSALQPVVW